MNAEQQKITSKQKVISLSDTKDDSQQNFKNESNMIIDNNNNIHATPKLDSAEAHKQIIDKHHENNIDFTHREHTGHGGGDVHNGHGRYGDGEHDAHGHGGHDAHGHGGHDAHGHGGHDAHGHGGHDAHGHGGHGHGGHGGHDAHGHGGHDAHGHGGHDAHGHGEHDAHGHGGHDAHGHGGHDAHGHGGHDAHGHGGHDAHGHGGHGHGSKGQSSIGLGALIFIVILLGFPTLFSEFDRFFSDQPNTGDNPGQGLLRSYTMSNSWTIDFAEVVKVTSSTIETAHSYVPVTYLHLASGERFMSLDMNSFRELGVSNAAVFMSQDAYRKVKDIQPGQFIIKVTGDPPIELILAGIAPLIVSIETL